MDDEDLIRETLKTQKVAEDVIDQTVVDLIDGNKLSDEAKRIRDLSVRCPESNILSKNCRPTKIGLSKCLQGRKRTNQQQPLASLISSWMLKSLKKLRKP